MRKSVMEKAESMAGKVNSRYSIKFSEVMELIEQSGGEFQAVLNAFRYGYMQGAKAARAEDRRKGNI